MKVTIKHISTVVRHRLGTKDTSPINLLKLMWNRDVYNILADNFQLGESGFNKESTFSMWIEFLAVVLQKCFYNCASFTELYEMDEKYGNVSKLMSMESFMAMKRGLSACESPGDDQRILNENFERVAGNDRTIDLDPWENLITRLTSPYIPNDPEMMIDDDHYNTVADPSAMATQKNRRKGSEGPLADAACNAHVRLVYAISLRRREPSAALSSVSRIVDRLSNVSRKPSIVFCDKGYSSFSIIE